MGKILPEHEKLIVDVLKDIRCCREEEGDSLFPIRAVNRTSTGLETQLRRPLLVTR